MVIFISSYKKILVCSFEMRIKIMMIMITKDNGNNYNDKKNNDDDRDYVNDIEIRNVPGY
jgi:hypothetical protein